MNSAGVTAFVKSPAGYSCALWLAIIAGNCLLATTARSQQAAPTLGRTIQVPLDYQQPNLGKGSLYFELGAPFDKSKPVVFIIADGQQFYVTRGSTANWQKSIFGSDFNVVGIVGRGFSESFRLFDVRVLFARADLRFGSFSVKKLLRYNVAEGTT